MIRELASFALAVAVGAFVALGLMRVLTAADKPACGHAMAYSGPFAPACADRSYPIRRI